MPRFKRNTCCRRVARKLCAILALLSYLAVGVGLPLPVLAHKDRSQPYPCQDHPCGCPNAEECWRHCCCFTPEQRWAWAEAHHVVPPAYAERPTGAQPDHDTGTPPTKSCCGQHRHDSPPPSPAGSRWVLGVEALRCHGLNTVWASTGAVVPPPPVLTWRPFWPLSGCLSFADAAPLPQVLTPPDPPPRPSCA
ncbi:MAG TPA: hypothetical protein VG013_08970 [Gemmataceae bacterium]|nr:hypothetical protein [Gemmataceae bacterium]